MTWRSWSTGWSRACAGQFGLPYWSFSSWAKVKVKKAVNYISAFQDVLAEEARRCEVDGIICGHIHHATIEEMEGVRYINTGDWVESCTAVVEHFDGRLELLHWAGASVATRRRGERDVPVTFPQDTAKAA